MSIMKYSQSEEFIYKDGNLIKMNQIDPVTGSTSSNSEFDSYGRTVKQFHFVKNAFRPATRYLYNEIDQTSTKIVFGTDSNIIHKTITLYNIRNKPVKTFEFDGKGTLSSSLIYQYNRHGDIIKACFINTPNGTGSHLDASFTGGEPKFIPWPNDSTTFEYKYGRHKKPKLVLKFHDSMLVKRTEYTSNSDTTITKEYEYLQGMKSYSNRTTTKIIDSLKIELKEFLNENMEVNDWFKYTYINDQLIESNSNCNVCRKNVYRYEYLYDNWGNWIRRNRFSNDSLVSITDRKIVYKN